MAVFAGDKVDKGHGRRRGGTRLWTIAAVAIFATAFLLGLAAEGRTFLQSLVAIAFLAAVLLLAWLWHETLHEAKTGRPPTRADRVWNALVFAAFLAAMLVIGWLWHQGYLDDHIWARGRADISPALPFDSSPDQ
jgi:hypothetical protein